MYMLPELGCYRHVPLLRSMGHPHFFRFTQAPLFLLFQDPVTGIPTWHDRPQSPLVM